MADLSEFEPTDLGDFIAVLEEANDYALATAAFTKDGGEPWEVEAGETAFLGRAITSTEVLADLRNARL